MPNNIISIGNYAFVNDSIAFGDTLRLPEHLESVDFSSFSCGETVHVVFPYNTYEPRYTVQNCKVVYFPKSIQSINMLGETQVKNIVWHIDANIPPELSFTSWSTTYVGYAKQSITVYVPKACVETYKNTDVWNELNILAEPILANGILVDQESIEIKKGNTAQLNAVVLPEDADDKSFIWSASDPNIVSVSQDGLATANSSGVALIFATLNADKTIVDTCQVIVYQPVTGISLNSIEKDVKVGDIFNLETTINPADADNKNVVWSSENDELANVVDGKVTALRPGIVRIYARSEYDNTIYATCEVAISQPATSIELNYNSYTLKSIGDLILLEPSITPEDATNKNVNWKSSNEAVCIVSNGKVVAVGEGTAVIIATTEDGGFMAVCTISVNTQTSINDVDVQNKGYSIYSADGKKLTSFEKGVNIIKFEDGKSIKIVK